MNLTPTASRISVQNRFGFHGWVDGTLRPRTGSRIACAMARESIGTRGMDRVGGAWLELSRLKLGNERVEIFTQRHRVVEAYRISGVVIERLAGQDRFHAVGGLRLLLPCS